MTRVPRRHGDRHGESKGTSTKISDLKKMILAYTLLYLGIPRYVPKDFYYN